MESDEALANDEQITVHNYQKISESSDDSILDEGRKLIGDVGSQWISIKVKNYTIEVNPTQCLVYHIPPPDVSAERVIPVSLKVWGESASEDEIYTLESLEEFIQTDFKALIFDHEGLSVANGANSSEVDVFGAVIFTKDAMLQQHTVTAHTSEGPRKKRRLDMQSLYRYIPQPHIHPSPYLPTEAPLMGRSFEPILPTSNSMSEDTRVAWVIPVRGVLPWEGCSSAVLIDDLEECISPSHNEIVWTRSTLLAFWDYLLGLRASAAMGALGISFHSRQNARRLGINSSDHNSTSASTHIAAGRSLMMSDYIKVYHDHGRRLHLRRLLADWSYSDSVEIGGVSKNVLQNAHLALLNDISQIILTL